MRTIFITSLFFIINISFSLAQKSPLKLGELRDIDMEYLKMSEYEKDTSANAIVLCDYGKSFFSTGSNNNFVVVHEKHIRIKILKNEGLDWANVEVPIYYASSGAERFYNLKGITYNLEDGKVIQTKLKNKEGVFKETINERWRKRNFTLPNVKKGSIIEYVYTIKSPYVYNYRSWDFQSSIPTLWSEYNASIHPYFEFQYIKQGYQLFDVNELTKKGYYRWVVKDAPAIREEKYITTLEDYITRIDFELIKFQYSDGVSAPEIVLGTWETANKELLKSDNFGKRLKLLPSLKNKVKSIATVYPDKQSQLEAIYKFVQSNIKWDGYNRKYATPNSNFKKVIDKGTGSSADMNLLLVAMLKEAGFNADPLILSTRKHGKVNPTYPILSKFNYVVCHLVLDGKRLLIDTTDPILPIGMLPKRCINWKGRVISENESQWVSLESKAIYHKIISANYKLNEEELLEGTVASVSKNYSALYHRKLGIGSENKALIEYNQKKLGDAEINNYKVENLLELKAPVKERYEFKTENNITVTDNAVYLNPLLGFEEKENPFKSDTRTYPVDFGAKQNFTFIMNFTIPEGYAVESRPENLNISLPQKTASFRYNISEFSNIIQVNCNINISNTLFLPKGYMYLKEFYAQIIAKQAEQIVFKKVN